MAYAMMKKATKPMPIMRHKRSQNARVLYTLVDGGVVDALMSISSTLLVRMEDVVLALHRQMADVPAIRGSGVGDHLVARDIMVEERVSPAAGLRESLRVLLDEESLRAGIRHIHDERGLRALLEAPLELRDVL